MKVVNIEIEDKQLSDLGIDQETTYTPFYFAESHFVGYWVGEEAIHFYVGADNYLCKKNQKNIELFNSILNK